MMTTTLTTVNMMVGTPILALTTSPTTMTLMVELIWKTMMFIAIMMAMLVLMALSDGVQQSPDNNFNYNKLCQF